MIRAIDFFENRVVPIIERYGPPIVFGLMAYLVAAR